MGTAKRETAVGSFFEALASFVSKGEKLLDLFIEEAEQDARR